MANKLLLDSGDYSALRILLNSTLYSGLQNTQEKGAPSKANAYSTSTSASATSATATATASGIYMGRNASRGHSDPTYINSTRLYDFAVKSLIPLEI